MDRIEINGLRVMTLVGVLPHEREAPQPLEVNLVLAIARKSSETHVHVCRLVQRVKHRCARGSGGTGGSGE